MIRLSWICLGGAIGTAARYGVTVGAMRLVGAKFPYGTLAVNTLGSFLMGAIMCAAMERDMNEELRFTLTTGFLGGFTTYSAFSYETVFALQKGLTAIGVANLVLTTVLCLGACAIGIAAAKAML
jgi:CrcB protein